MKQPGEDRQRRAMTIVKAYPLGVLVIAVLLNFFVFGVDPVAMSLPSAECVRALVIAALRLNGCGVIGIGGVSFI